MPVNVFLNFDGNCKEAALFYAKVFGCEEPKMMTFGDVPPDPAFQLSEPDKKRVMFTELYVDGCRIMMSDVPPGLPFAVGNNISIALVGKDKAKLEAWFYGLSEGGQVVMPPASTFWSVLYGMVTDQFGIGWQINCEKD